MTPFSSVAILEKLALLKIAFCRAPVFSRASSRRTSVMTSTKPAPSSAKAATCPFAIWFSFLNPVAIELPGESTHGRYQPLHPAPSGGQEPELHFTLAERSSYARATASDCPL